MAIGARPSQARWRARRQQDCSASTSTCRRPCRRTSRWRSPAAGRRRRDFSEKERAAFEQLDTFFKKYMAYAAMMGTRPQTIGYALTDTPVGLAAWIVRLQQRRARAPARQGRLPRRRHAVLADEHRDLGSADLLGNRRPEHCSCGRAEDCRHRAPGGHLGVSRRGLSRSGDMGPARLSQPRFTSTKSTRAATSPPGSSRSSSVPRLRAAFRSMR